MVNAAEDNDFLRWWDARMAAMEGVFGKSSEMVGHATIPFDLGVEMGGAADIVYFKNFVPGVLSVTSELIGRDNQVPNALGNYELAICHRDDEAWGPELISVLSYYTLDHAINPGETMDISSAAPAGSRIAALLFLELARFSVLERDAGVLLCIGISGDELAACHKSRAEQVEVALRKGGIYPFTDFGRDSVYLPIKKWGLF
jgi:Suppressor of fused protein (SUFU)